MNKIKWLRLLSGCIHSYLCIPILRLRRELGLWGTLIMIIFMLVALYSEPERRPPLQAGQGPSVQSQRHDNRLHKTLTKKQWSQQLSDFVRETSLTTSSNYKQELHLIRKFWNFVNHFNSLHLEYCDIFQYCGICVLNFDWHILNIEERFYQSGQKFCTVTWSVKIPIK